MYGEYIYDEFEEVEPEKEYLLRGDGGPSTPVWPIDGDGSKSGELGKDEKEIQDIYPNTLKPTTGLYCTPIGDCSKNPLSY